MSEKGKKKVLFIIVVLGMLLMVFCAWMSTHTTTLVTAEKTRQPFVQMRKDVVAERILWTCAYNTATECNKLKKEVQNQME